MWYFSNNKIMTPPITKNKYYCKQIRLLYRALCHTQTLFILHSSPLCWPWIMFGFAMQYKNRKMSFFFWCKWCFWLWKSQKVDWGEGRGTLPTYVFFTEAKAKTNTCRVIIQRRKVGQLAASCLHQGNVAFSIQERWLYHWYDIIAARCFCCGLMW